MATLKEKIAEMRGQIADLRAETAELRTELGAVGASLEFAFAAGVEHAGRSVTRGAKRTRPPHLRSVGSGTRAVKG